MSEIAQMAGVSQSTVSRVLTHGRTFQIGVLTRHLGSPFFNEMLRGMAKGMEGTSYHPVIGLGSEIPREDRLALDLLLARRVDGLLLQAPQNSPQVNFDYLLELAEHTPLIIIGTRIPGLEKQCVSIKNFNGGYIATSHLIEKGHKFIAHITGRMPVEDSVERRDGYCQALIDNGLEVVPELIIEGDFSENSGTQGMDTLLARREQFPFIVPDEISLVGFDDLPGTQYMIPPLTTIRQPVYYMGLIASQALLAMVAGKEVQLPEFPLELVSRQSVAIR